MPSEGDGLRDLLATYDDEKMMIKWWLWLWWCQAAENEAVIIVLGMSKGSGAGLKVVIIGNNKGNKDVNKWYYQYIFISITVTHLALPDITRHYPALRGIWRHLMPPNATYAGMTRHDPALKFIFVALRSTKMGFHVGSCRVSGMTWH